MNKLKFLTFNIFLFGFTLLISYGIGTGEPLDKEGIFSDGALLIKENYTNFRCEYPVPSTESLFLLFTK